MNLLPQKQSPDPARPESRLESSKKNLYDPSQVLGAALTLRNQDHKPVRKLHLQADRTACLTLKRVIFINK